MHEEGKNRIPPGVEWVTPSLQTPPAPSSLLEASATGAGGTRCQSPSAVCWAPSDGLLHCRELPGRGAPGDQSLPKGETSRDGRSSHQPPPDTGVPSRFLHPCTAQQPSTRDIHTRVQHQLLGLAGAEPGPGSARARAEGLAGQAGIAGAEGLISDGQAPAVPGLGSPTLLIGIPQALVSCSFTLLRHQATCCPGTPLNKGQCPPTSNPSWAAPARPGDGAP